MVDAARLARRACLAGLVLIIALRGEVVVGMGIVPGKEWNVSVLTDG